jgi:hypothetical protein
MRSQDSGSGGLGSGRRYAAFPDLIQSCLSDQVGSGCDEPDPNLFNTLGPQTDQVGSGKTADQVAGSGAKNALILSNLIRYPWLCRSRGG